MSIRLMNETMDTDLAVSSKMVMLVLCDFADDGGRNCWPAIETIAAKSSLSERQTQRVMAELKREQLIAVAGSNVIGRRVLSNRYVINLKKLSDMAAEGRRRREELQQSRGDNMSPPVSDFFDDETPVDKCELEPETGVTFATEGVTFATTGVTSTTSRGDTHVTQSTINHHKSIQRGARAPETVDNFSGSPPPEPDDGEALREFPLDWQPCETCRSVLKVRNVDWPAQHVIDAFAAHQAGRWIAPRRIPNEFLKWVARQRGMDARSTAATPAKKSVSDEALRAWEEVRAANQLERSPPAGWSDARTPLALAEIGGLSSLRDMRTSDVPFRQKDFVNAFSRIASPAKRSATA